MTAPLKVPLPDGAVADALRRAGEPATVPGRRRYAGHLRDTWPVHRRQSAQLVGGWLVLTVAWVALGKLLTGPLADSVIVRFDERLAKSVVAHRTPTWDHVTLLGSFLAETITKVIVTAIVALVFLKLWRRWFEPVVLVVSLAIEASAFIVVTAIVGRDRPDVPRLARQWDQAFPAGTRPLPPHTSPSPSWCSGTPGTDWHALWR